MHSSHIWRKTNLPWHFSCGGRKFLANTNIIVEREPEAASCPLSALILPLPRSMLHYPPPLPPRSSKFSFSFPEWERPLHQRAFQLRWLEREEETGSNRVSQSSLEWNRVTGFLPDLLTLADGNPQRPSPTHRSSPRTENEKKRRKRKGREKEKEKEERSKQHVTTHPSGYILICLKEERREREKSTPLRLQFSP